jgi:peptide deformylase
MSILKVARMGHPVLRTKARPLTPADVRSHEIQRLIDDMFETMAEYHGVGLAAPQIHEDLRLFVADLSARDEEHEIVEDWEGCLSIPDSRGSVPRARAIKVRALDRWGKRLELSVQDFSARVIQHETDHLDGILFFDRMRAFDSLTFLDEYARYWAKPADDD